MRVRHFLIFAILMGTLNYLETVRLSLKLWLDVSRYFSSLYGLYWIKFNYFFQDMLLTRNILWLYLDGIDRLVYGQNLIILLRFFHTHEFFLYFRITENVKIKFGSLCARSIFPIIKFFIFWEENSQLVLKYCSIQ